MGEEHPATSGDPDFQRSRYECGVDFVEYSDGMRMYRDTVK